MERESQFELLRFVAIMFVMIVPALPSISKLEGLLAHSLFLLVENCVLVGVNLFILISGWFTIRLKLKSVLNFAFLVFFGLATMLALQFSQGEALRVGVIANGLNPFRNWFISAYVLLMLLSPLINAFVDLASTHKIFSYMIGFLILELVVDHLLPLKMWGVFSGGYSHLGFIGVYLLGAWLRRIADAKCLTKVNCVAMYLVSVLLTTMLGLVCVVLVKHGILVGACNHMLWRLFAYSSPLVLCAATGLFLFIGKLRFSSAIVNHMEQSVFWNLPCALHSTLRATRPENDIRLLMEWRIARNCYILYLWSDKARVVECR